VGLACLAHVNFFAAHLLFDVITEQINDDDDDDMCGEIDSSINDGIKKCLVFEPRV